MAPGVIVRTAAGLVEGKAEEGVLAFLGVPYAAPPFGEHRFRAPAAVPSWAGVRQAVTRGAAAPQAAGEDIGLYAPDVFETGQDCLNLDVHTPSVHPGGLPVLVWIHGGAFAIGGNGAAWHQGHRFARDGVVCVAINYRLGFEGFLALDDAPLNRGVLDWLAALEWVCDNIEAFGGDPGNVTIAGQSAGGAAVATLLSMPRATGLFHRAIVMSGSATLVAGEQEARSYAKTLAARLGIEPTRSAFARLSPADLVAEQPPPLAGDSGGLAESVPIKPVVDGDLIPAVPLTALRGDVPLLVGCTSQEADVFVRRMVSDIDEASAQALVTHLGAHAVVRGVTAASPAELVGRAFTWHLFTRETRWIHEARPAYAYEFHWESPVESPVGGGRVGAVHNLDLPFVFDLLDAPGVERTAGPDAPRALAAEMHAAWVRFVRTGDPGWPLGHPKIFNGGS
ncbi:carboxylesterase/lipase family protein [Nonomuraea soli]|uniref:Carboxylic ester hydrolase n=1 Tax=Nonomuraea soli TaxID=1032476 RepID=A0A7W0CQH2_9ACTN|nr:carboxylesterase family protein [Nonomuraea soli]MBA2895437.1 para-nitrobenzyl esterase [Nonomuraea soli]